MRRFFPILCCVLSLLLGLSVGWYLGYTRPSVRDQKKVLSEYERVRDSFQLSDKEMEEWGGRLPEFLEASKREDEMAATIALAALVKLEQGDIEKTRSRLQTAISIYYRGHNRDGDSNVLRHITSFAATNAGLSNAIYRKLE